MVAAAVGAEYCGAGAAAGAGLPFGPFNTWKPFLPAVYFTIRCCPSASTNPYWP